MRSPYEVLFGGDAKLGCDTNTLPERLKSALLLSEEDVDRLSRADDADAVNLKLLASFTNDASVELQIEQTVRTATRLYMYLRSPRTFRKFERARSSVLFRISRKPAL
jgi:hypothetical protein